MKKAVTYFTSFVILCCLLGLAWWLGRLTAPAEFTYVTDTVTDTITDWQYDTVYRYDTILKDTHSTTRLTASLSGYEVRVDTLAVTTTIEPIIIKETLPWCKRIRPSVGVGIGTNLKGEATAGVFFGIGYLF